ncbi:MAG: hypothetical protein WAZ14_01410 [Patescibacteria group bacterium]
MRKFWMFTGCLLIFGLSCHRSALALVATPSAATLQVEIGEQAIQSLNYENDAGVTEEFQLSLMEVEFGESADDLRFLPLSESKRAAVSLSAETLHLEPGTSQAVEVRINAGQISENYALAVLAMGVAQGGAGVNVASAQANLVFVNVGAVAPVTLNIDSFSTIPEQDHASPIKFAVLLSNQGDGVAQPKVGVQIKNMWGKEVEVVPLNPTGRRIPGQTSRIFSADWQASKFQTGVYRATVYVYPDDSEQVLTQELRVVLFSWRLLCILAGAGVLLIASGLILRRAMSR